MQTPGHRVNKRIALLTAGFRVFYLAAALWAVLAVPLWLAAYAAGYVLPTGSPPLIWHAHAMIYGYGSAVLAAVLLLSLQGRPLMVMIALWLTGRAAMLFSAAIGVRFAAAAELAFPVVFLVVMAEEIVATRNWRNLPVLGALLALLCGDALVQLGVTGFADTALLGNRIGVATLLFMIAFVGGRIVPDFTRQWIAKHRPEIKGPVPPGLLDTVALMVTLLALAGWVAAPDRTLTAWMLLAGGAAALARLARWQGWATLHEPLVAVLHIGYGWLGAGLLLLGANGFFAFMPSPDALHALTIGAIGTMTLAVMTRATLEHTGARLSADTATVAVYGFITAAAILRIAAAVAGDNTTALLWLAGGCWEGAFVLFLAFYGARLIRPRTLPFASVRRQVVGRGA
ncbi:MAG: NnrS family protein [Alphaproteobacteria bacterium]|nr:NnrS family protein [Alphaproteobacteria bacterium]MDE2012097.1 NnrS family protein [Alphaproteobacteria bacterium]MDE2073394.1 NnrS family protein [Alphaproteobacteria bacterium]MDE2350580.1 NnrS family protein [Alphaproteobacteria bacterium]